MDQQREFDVIVLGATGFTGKLVAEYLYDTYGDKGELAWAVAGRNADKLDAVVAGLDADKPAAIEKLLVDTSDQAAVDALAQRTRVICTTVGPYSLYGTPVVAACAKAGTHYVDLAGEVQWMHRVINQYQTEAEASGAKIVHTCGFDSIPSDLGVHYVQREMQARFGRYADQVKYRLVDASGGMSGGTIASLMNMREEIKVDPSLEDVVNDPYALNPVNTPPGKDIGDQVAALYDQDMRQWTAPFVMAMINTRVVRRSHALAGFPYGQEFRYDEAMLTGDGPLGYMKAVAIASGSFLMMLASSLSPLRSMLKPVLPAQGEGPSEQAIENGFFVVDVFAKCTDDKTKHLTARLTADRDPGYGATSRMLGESAVCLAKDALPEVKGFLTPATAMGDALITRLQDKAGMTFTIKD